MIPGATSSSTGPIGLGDSGNAPKNPLWRILWEMQRPKGAVAGAVEELYKRGRDPAYEKENLFKVMGRGFKDVKQFSEFVDEPWAAFVLEVAFDPLTYIPGGVVAKGAKAPFLLAGKGAKASGLTKLAPVVATIDSLDAAKWALAEKFAKGRNLSKFDIGGKIGKLLIERDINEAKWGRLLGENVADSISAMAGSAKEAEEVSWMLALTPRGGSLLDTAVNAPAGIIARANDLTDGGKQAYKLGLEAIQKVEGIRKSEFLVSAARMEGFIDKNLGKTYFPWLFGNHANDILQRLHGSKALLELRSGKIRPSTAVKISKAIPEEFHPLGELVYSSKSYKDFMFKASKAAEGTTQRTLAKDILWDENRGSFLKAVDRIKIDLRAAGQPEELWPVEMSLHLRKNPSGKLAKAIRRVAGTRFTSGQMLMREEDLMHLAEMPAKTPFTGTKDFFSKVRKSFTVGGKHVSTSGIPRQVPTAGETIQGMDEAIKQITNMAPNDDWVKLQKQALEIADGDGTPMPGLEEAFFQRHRKSPFTIEELDALHRAGYDLLEMNAAKVLRVSGLETARIVAARKFSGQFLEWATKESLVVPEAIEKDPIAFANWLGEFGAKHGDDVRKIVERKGLEPVLPGLVKGWKAPKEIAAEINNAFNTTLDPQKMGYFHKLYTTVLGYWKGHTLSLFLSYHSRNYLSNMWNNFLAGMGADPTYFARDLNYYKKATALQWKFRQYAKNPNILNDEELKLYNTLRDRGVANSGEFVGELGDIVDSMLQPRSMWNPRNWLDPRRNFAVQKGFQAGRAIENQARIAHFLWATEAKGMSVDDAVRSVNKYLFDYRSGLTPFENKWMRNGLMPFYAWTRFNLPLQLEMLARYPAKYANVYKAKLAAEDQWGGARPEEEFMEDWLKYSTNVRWRWNQDKGTHEYFMWDSWWPGADVNKVMSTKVFGDTLLGMLSPFAKVPFELLYNRNLFTKKQISEFGESPFSMKGATGTIKVGVPGAVANVQMPPGVEFILRHIRYVNEMDRFLAGEKDQSMEGRMARVMLGKSYPYSQEKQRQRWVRDIGIRISRLKYAEKMALKEGNKKKAEETRKLINEAESMKRYYR